MTVQVEFRPIQLLTCSADREGQLLLADDALVAVVVRLSQIHGAEYMNHWYVEAAFGLCATAATTAPEQWVRHRTAALAPPS
jgi:hypothetical protein